MHHERRFEQLCRYISRPAIANDRLKLNSAGDVVLQLKSPYRNGTTHIVMTPLEFMCRNLPALQREYCFHGAEYSPFRLGSPVLFDAMHGIIEKLRCAILGAFASSRENSLKIWLTVWI